MHLLVTLGFVSSCRNYRQRCFEEKWCVFTFYHLPQKTNNVNDVGEIGNIQHFSYSKHIKILRSQPFWCRIWIFINLWLHIKNIKNKNILVKSNNYLYPNLYYHEFKIKVFLRSYDIQSFNRTGALNRVTKNEVITFIVWTVIFYKSITFDENATS